MLCRDDRSSVYPSQSVNRPFSPPLFIEEVAQAKRSDGGVLKVEQPGGPLAVELNLYYVVKSSVCEISLFTFIYMSIYEIPRRYARSG